MKYVPEMMDKKVIVQRATVTRGDSGSEVLTFADWKTRWAAIDYASGSERLEADKETASMTVYFTMREVAGLTEKDRISYNGYYFNIRSIIPNGRKHFQTIETEFRR